MDALPEGRVRQPPGEELFLMTGAPDAQAANIAENQKPCPRTCADRWRSATSQGHSRSVAGVRS